MSSSLASSSSVTTAAAVSNAQAAPMVPSTLPRAVAAASSILAQSSSSSQPVIFIVMGTSGSGKSTLGALLASTLSLPFIDADDLHPPSNVAKMASGTPLDDSDREPWLIKVRETALELASSSGGVRAGDITPAYDMPREQRSKVKAEAEAYEASYLSRHAGQGQLHLQAGSVARFVPSSADREGVKVQACVVACSALKRTYRDLLRGHRLSLSDPQESVSESSFDGARTVHVYLRVSTDELLRRMKARKGHFMKEGMLRSQLATLEEPDGEREPDVVVVDERDEDAKTGLENLAGASTSTSAPAQATGGGKAQAAQLEATWEVHLSGELRTGHLSKPLDSTSTPAGNSERRQLSSLSASLREMHSELNEMLTKLKDEVPKEEERDAEALGFGKGARKVKQGENGAAEEEEEDEDSEDEE